jgi:hypothetical protein
MARGEAFLAGAYVALGVAASYALDAVLPDGDFSIHEEGGAWLVGYLALGIVASVLLGAAVRRPWAPVLPFVIAPATIPAGDVLFELPLVALTLVLAIPAALAVGVGRAIAAFAASPNVDNAVLLSVVLLFLALPIGIAFAMADGFNPWEDEQGPSAGPVAFGIGCTYLVGVTCTALAALALRRRGSRGGSRPAAASASRRGT